MRAVWPKPSLAVLPPTVAVGISEVSRFSCMKFLGVSGVFDYAGLNRNSRYRSCSCCLPRITRTSASGLHLFGALLPTPPIPLFTLRRVPRGTQRKTRGRADRYSLLVRILHSLLHAGLSRRTVMEMFRQQSCGARGTAGRLSSRENLQSPSPSPSSGGWTRCPHPCRGPGCHFVVFSFDPSKAIVVLPERCCL